MWVCPKGRGMPRCHGPYFRFPRGDPKKLGEETLSREQGPGTEGRAGARISFRLTRRQATALVLHDGHSALAGRPAGGFPRITAPSLSLQHWSPQMLPGRGSYEEGVPRRKGVMGRMGFPGRRGDRKYSLLDCTEEGSPTAS